MRQFFNTSLFVCLLVLGMNHAQAADMHDHFVPPADAGMVNVKTDFGATGDGKTDDTDAIRKAIVKALSGSRYNSPQFVYFPQGTYLISGPLEGKVADFGWAGGWRSGCLLVGEGRDLTTIKLKDAAEGYTDSARHKWMIAVGSESDKKTKEGDLPLSGGGNRAFRNSIINMTIDTGKNNPGAIALDYVANNRGTVRNVRLVGGEGSGWCGLRLERNWPGPCYIRDVQIDGFEFGVRAAHAQYGVTFENILLRDQRSVGILNTDNVLVFRNLKSVSNVHVYKSERDNALLTVIEGEFTYKDGRTTMAAIQSKSRMMLRNIKVNGYKLLANDTSVKPGLDVELDKTGHVAFYASKINSDNTSVVSEYQPLPIEDSPKFWTDDMSQWVCPQKFFTTPGRPKDCTEAVQSALNDGKPVVYLPNGHYPVTKTLIVPPHVRLIIGFQSGIGFPKDMDKTDLPLFQFAGKGGTATILQHLRITGSLLHDADRAVVLNHCDVMRGYENTKQGTGDLFLEDTCGPKPLLINYPQNVWARQLNIEFGSEPLIENHGGNLWILGYKTEGEMTCLLQTSGKCEIYGSLLYPLKNRNPIGPAYVIQGGQFATSTAMNSRGYQLFVGSELENKDNAVSRKDVGRRSATWITFGH